jgi:phenylacetate-CoA ligase
MLSRGILEHALLPLGDLALGTAFTAKLKAWRDLQWLSGRALEQVQTDNLRRLLKHASTQVPFYREKEVQPDQDVRRWLRRFPVITKAGVKARIDDFILGDKGRLVEEASSGSSGIQGSVYMSKLEQSNVRAIQTLWWEWAGYRLGEPIVQTGMTLKRGLVKGVKDRMLRTDYWPAFQLDERLISALLQRLRRRPRTMLLGYASSLYLIARVAQALRLNDITFKSVVSWGDKMFEHYRRTIEAQFRTVVHDTYACTEGFMIAAQCEEQRYHVMKPQVYVELLDDDLREVAPGELGYVVVTRLDNYSMPLIRYYLGDLAIKQSESTTCPCGRNLPMLRRVVGRDTDMVRTASGKHMIVHFFTAIFEQVPEIRQFQVIQRNLREIEIAFIRDRGFHGGVLRRVEQAIHARLREPFPIVFREVTEIHPTPSGKPQIVQSFLPPSVGLQPSEDLEGRLVKAGLQA